MKTKKQIKKKIKKIDKTLENRNIPWSDYQKGKFMGWMEALYWIKN